MSNAIFTDRHTEDTVSRFAQYETGKRQYYRPVYSLHKWWARRPGSLFRSIILLAAHQDKNLFSFNKELSVSIKNNEYFHNHNLEDCVIFDPFMGGGTTLVEANRLGAKVIGCDLNSVSYWIVRETLKPIDLEKLSDYFKELEQSAGKRIKALYQSTCTQCACPVDSLYVFWLRYVHCHHCGKPVYLFKQTLLNKGEYRNKPVSLNNPATVFCPKCFSLYAWSGEKICLCPRCSSTFDPQEGTYNRGYYQCPNCQNAQISLIKTLETGQRLKEQLLAIEYWCEKCQKRQYKSPEKHDHENIKTIENMFNSSKEQFIFPKQEILEGASSLRWRRHNYRYYYEVFNARQLLAFTYLIQAIQKIPEPEYQFAFLTMFSNSLEYNNMMTPYTR